MTIPKTISKDLYVVKKGLSGLGLFAKSLIKKNSWIIEYTGIRKTEKESRNLKTQYLFEVNKKITIDGSGRENIARYINYSCIPNAEAWNVNNRIFIRAIKDIMSGEEISYDYGKEFFEKFIKPKGCCCVKCLSKKTHCKKNSFM